jgi:hypothetical protein
MIDNALLGGSEAWPRSRGPAARRNLRGTMIAIACVKVITESYT